jgi:hypothetical protein
MLHWEAIWCQDIVRRIQDTKDQDHHGHQILSQVSQSSSLVRILQAIEFIAYPLYQPMFKIHIMLYSWDELRRTFCSLRSLIGHEGEGLIRNLPIAALDMALSPAHLLLDLACGCRRVMRRMLSGEVDQYFR